MTRLALAAAVRRQGVTATVMIVNPAAATAAPPQWPDIRGGRGARPRRRRAPDRAARTRDPSWRRRPSPRGELVVAVGGDGPSRSRKRHGRSGRDHLAVCSGAPDATSPAPFALKMPTRLEVRACARPHHRHGAHQLRGRDGRPEPHFVNVASGRPDRGRGRPGQPQRQAAGRDRCVRVAAVATFAGYSNSPFTSRSTTSASNRLQQRDRRQLPRTSPGNEDRAGRRSSTACWTFWCGDVSRLDLLATCTALSRHAHTPPKATIVAPAGCGDAALAAADRGRRRAAGLTPATFEVVPSALRLRAPG